MTVLLQKGAEVYPWWTHQGAEQNAFCRGQTPKEKEGAKPYLISSSYKFIKGKSEEVGQ